MDALTFECQAGCTNCCRAKGFVYITESDLDRASKYLGVTRDDFEQRYVFRTRHLLRLRKPRNSQCYFLRDYGCSIHAAKPTQCRLFPFWPELVEDRDNWAEAASNCPGIGNGALIQIGAAVELANEMRSAYPGMYSLEPLVD
jgi:Fe-S-cluster containining protein